MEFPLTPTELTVFSAIQVDVFNKKLNMTYDDIIACTPGVTTHKMVSAILLNTFMGIAYSPGEKGRRPLVGDVQMSLFKEKLEQAAEQNKAVSYFEAITMLQEIQGDYLWASYKRALKMGCREMAQNLLFEESREFSCSWFSTILKRWNIEVKNAEKLEEIRNKYCHTNVIRRFYENIISNLPQDPRLLYNADETASSFNSKGKVLVPTGHFPIRYQESVSGHFTSICAFNADGSHILKPFIILPQLRNFPNDLKMLENWAFFSSSPSGWITGRLFIAFCIYFCNMVSKFKAEQEITADSWLIIDGHKTRANSIAVEYCAQHGVQLVILPAHTSHVTQPFDVGLASPMKTKIRQLYDKPNHFVSSVIENTTSMAGKIRVKIIGAIVNAWWTVATPGNCASAFSKAGIYPYKLETVLDNKFVRESQNDDQDAPERGLRINSSVITTDQKRIEIARHFYNRDIADLNGIPRYHNLQLHGWLKTGSDLVFSTFPKFQEQVFPGIVFHVF